MNTSVSTALFSSRTRWALFAAGLALAVAGCAGMSSTRAPSEALTRYQSVAGPSVQFLPFWRLEEWEAVDDEHLVVWTSRREAWLLQVWPNCNGLISSPTIALTSSVHRVYANIDKVLLAQHEVCRIQDIRSIDVAALKRAREAAKSGQASPGT